MRKKIKDIPDSESELLTFISTYLDSGIREFYRSFKNSEECMVRLWRWKGWEYKTHLRKLIFKCQNPDCDGREAYLIKKINHGKNERVVFRCIRCNTAPSAVSDTVFKGMRKRLWLWFFSLYLMIILDGKKSVSAVVMQYFNLEIYKEEWNVKDTAEFRHAIRKQVREIMASLERRMFKTEDAIELQIRYSTLVGLGTHFRFPDFLKWYGAEEKNKRNWKVAWCGLKSNVISPIIRQKIGKKHNLDPPQFYVSKLFQDVGNVSEGDWLLAFMIRTNGIISLRWVYVEEIVRLSNALDLLKDSPGEIEQIIAGEFKFQIMQINKFPRFLNRPFKLTRTFSKAFKVSLKEYLEIHKSEVREERIFDCPKEILDRTAHRMMKVY